MTIIYLVYVSFVSFLVVLEAETGFSVLFFIQNPKKKKGRIHKQEFQFHPRKKWWFFFSCFISSYSWQDLTIDWGDIILFWVQVFKSSIFLFKMPNIYTLIFYSNIVDKGGQRGGGDIYAPLEKFKQITYDREISMRSTL